MFAPANGFFLRMQGEIIIVSDFVLRETVLLPNKGEDVRISSFANDGFDFGISRYNLLLANI